MYDFSESILGAWKNDTQSTNNLISPKMDGMSIDDLIITVFWLVDDPLKKL